jgi:hypothetical protein
MKKILVLSVVIFSLLFLSCATVGTRPVITDTFTINAPFDKVWGSLIKYVSVKNIPIKIVEKASGLLDTDLFTYAQGSGIYVAGELNKIAVMQSSFMQVYTSSRCKFNFYVASSDANTTQIKITTYIEAFDNTTQNWYECYSNGTLEANIFNGINQNIEVK